MKWKRWLLVTLIVLAVVTGGLYIAARVYLHSSAVATKVAQQLEEELGVPVKVGSASVGLFGSTTVHDVRLHESEGNATAWLTVQEITTDISAVDILRGKIQPKRVALKGVKAELRYDKEGELLTQLPSKKKEKPSKLPQMPVITVDGGQVTVHQEGRPTFVLRGLDVKLTEEGDVQTVAGTINDPDWGALTLDGHMGPATGMGELVLRGDRVHVTTERLKSVPLASPTIWQQVQGNGDTRAELRLTLRPKDVMTYQITLEPQGATIDVAAVHLHSTQTTGRIVIGQDAGADGELVTLRDMRGRAAEGEVLLSGDLDFRGEVDKLHFNVSVKHAKMEELSEHWTVPETVRKITGKLTGHADLTVTVGDTVRTDGQGEGKIENASIEGLPTDGPITLKLRYKNGAPEFTTEMSTSAPALRLRNALLPLLLFVLAPPPPAQPPESGGNLHSDVLSAPGRAASLLRQGVSQAGHALSSAGRSAVGVLPKKEQGDAPAKPPAKVTYFDLNFGFKDIDLAQLVKRFNLPVPFPVAGRGSFHIHASLPVNSPKDVALYKLTGTLDISQLKAAGLELDKLTARIKLDKGVLQLSELSGDLGGIPGSGDTTGRALAHFKGSARAQIAPLGAASADLALTGIPLEQVASLVPSVKGKLAGILNASLVFRAPVKDIRDPASWNGRLSVRADRLEVFGWAVDQVSTTAIVKDGELTVPSLKGGLQGLQVVGSGKASLRGRYPFQAHVGLERADLEALKRLARGVKLPVDVKGRLTFGADARGTLKPLTVDAGGSVEAASLAIDTVAVQSFSAAWKADTRTLTLDKIRAKLYQGEVTGSASAPLDATVPGSISLSIANLDVGALSKSIAKFPVRLAGKASGSIQGNLSAAAPGKPRALTTKVDIKAPRLRVQNIPADRLHGTVNYKSGIVQYKLEGETLGGTFDVEGQLPPRTERSSSAGPLPPGAVAFVQAQPPPAQGGRLRFRRLSLRRLWEALNVQGFLGQLGGRLDISLDYQLGAKPEDTTGSGRVVLRGLRWGDTDLTDELSGALRLRGERLTLPNLSGIVGEGLLRATAGVNLSRPGRSWFAIHLEGVRAERLLSVFPGLEGKIEGPLDVNVRGHAGRRWQGHGEAALAHGKVLGAEISEWRVPFSFEFDPLEGGRLDIQDSQAQMGLGRLNAEVHAAFGASSRLHGQLRFLRVELRNVFRSIDETLPVGAGRVSGRFDFIGQDVRSFDDVSGRLLATFSQSQALEFPGLRQIAPYLRLTPSLRIDKGDMRAFLSRGLLRVNRLALSGQNLKLFANGTVYLSSGRLDLAVMARTGLVGVAAPVLQVLGVASVGAVPVAALVRATAWLSNTTIRLRVTGTLRSPSIQFEPLRRFLSEEVLRFFLYQYALPYDAASSFLNSP